MKQRLQITNGFLAVKIKVPVNEITPARNVSPNSEDRKAAMFDTIKIMCRDDF